MNGTFIFEALYSFMKIKCDQVLVYLKQLQEEHGGYYGTDIANLANDLGVTWRGIQKSYRFVKRMTPDLKVLCI